MSYEILIIDLLLGACAASIGAHPRFSNLGLVKSLKIGLLSGAIGAVSYLLLSYLAPGLDLFAQALSIIIVMVAGAAIVMWNFFRDPERRPPADKNVIVAPADGRIIYLRETKRGAVPCAIKGKKCIRLDEIAKTDLLSGRDGYIVGIMMNILDVHVTRSPVDGAVTKINSISGKTLSPKDWRSEVDNPRTVVLLKNERLDLGLVEIGTPYVSKVLTFVKEGDTMKKGERLGRITWGSQFDLIIPSVDLEFLVKEGDSVYAGETIIARIK